MKIKLGAIGEENSLVVINKIILEYRTKYEYFPFIYRKEDEICKFIEDNQEKVDVWLVFGQLDYQRIMAWGQAQKPVYCIAYRGASFYKVLCEALYKNYKVEEMSIDTIPYDELMLGFEEMHIEYKTIQYKMSASNNSIAAYINFHKRLFMAGKSKLAITSSWSVKMALEKIHMQVLCVLPLRVSVCMGLNMILTEFQIKALRDEQIAVQVFDYDLHGQDDSMCSLDDLYSREIIVSQKLIAYAKQIQGSLKIIGQGRFVIFTTRGLLAAYTNDFKSIPHDNYLFDIEAKLVACGIGLGKSAGDAELNAVTALRHSRKNKNGEWFVIMDDKKIIGPLGEKNQLTYDYYSEKLQTISEKASVSVTNLSKIESAIQKYGRNTISARELAISLQIIPRSARRILHKLVAAGLAKEIGDENPNYRGRPRKVFVIDLND